MGEQSPSIAEMAAEISQCAVELAEAARIIQPTYPGVAGLYVAAASRARAAAIKALGDCSELKQPRSSP